MYNSKWKVFKHIPSTCDEYEWTSKSNEMHNINEGKRRWGRTELWLYPLTIATQFKSPAFDTLVEHYQALYTTEHRSV